MASDPPKFIYKILPDAPPSPFPPQLPPTELDARDGFIHLCTADQVAPTADLVFPASTRLWVVKLPLPLPSSSPDRAGSSNTVRFEDGYPHLYGDLVATDINSASRFERRPDQTWADSLSLSSWFE